MGSIAPDPQRTHKVVCLDAYLCPVPKFDFPHECVEYENTVGEDLIIERAKDATIVITTRAPMSARTISLCPRLEMISLMAAGANIIDMEACRQRKITVCNSPSGAASSVAEHAFALYFAAKRKIVDLHHITLEGKEWPRAQSAFHLYPFVPRVLEHEVLGIVGYGGIGKRMEAIGRGLGMKVLIAERKHTAGTSLRPGRTAFETVLKTATVLMLGCPLDAESLDMITETELRQMRRDATIVNVARGGVLNESALVQALNEGWIASAATDVFALEPATAISTPLISKHPPNLTVSPHVAWYADATLEKLQQIVRGNLEAYIADQPQNLVNGSWSVYERSGSMST